MDHRSTILLLRIVACVVIAAAMGACIGQLHSISDFTIFAILTPVAFFAFGAGIGAILFGIGAILQQRQKPGDAAPATLAQHQLVDLALKMEDLGASIDRLTRVRDAAPGSLSHAPPDAAPAANTPAVLAALQTLFEELRDLSLLPDEQRQVRWHQLQEQRKEIAIQSASALVQNRQWSQAQSAIAEMENEWPADAAVGAMRKELDAARLKAEAEAMRLAAGQIESEMSLSHWEQAAILARKLAGDFPASEQAVNLLKRVEREKAIYTDAAVGRLYDEIRHDVERRVWRRAAGHAQQLLERFPDHPRSELIRKQIHTIQENAGIEERQEQETRIGELIRARRFREAVQLSEELLRRFPTSPQAEAIQKLLPRIRELAAEGEAKAAQPSSA